MRAAAADTFCSAPRTAHDWEFGHKLSIDIGDFLENQKTELTMRSLV